MGRLKLEKVLIPLRKPYVHQGFELSQRQLARVVLSRGHHVWEAELGPFPGVNEESFEEAWDQIRAYQEAMADFILSDQPHMEDLGFGFSEACQLYPSVISALEQLLIHKYFNAKHPKGLLVDFEVAGLLVLEKGWEKDLRDLISRGYRCFKVKIGRGSLADELSAMKTLVELLPTHSRLRLDTNQALGKDAILKFVDLLPSDSLEYVEEPSDSESSGGGVPVAYDESLWGKEEVFLRPIDRVILKAQRLPFSKIIRLLNQGRLSHKQIVLSSCFDGSLALKNYLRFAALYKLNSAHGFGPFHSLLKDSTTDGLPPLSGVNTGIVI